MMDFKEFDEAVEGSVVLPMTGEETGVLYVKDLVYASYGDLDLHLQILAPTSPKRRIMPPMPEELRKQFGLPEFNPDWSYPCIVYIPGSAWAKQNVYGEIGDLSRYVSGASWSPSWNTGTIPWRPFRHLLWMPGTQSAT